MLKSVMYHRGHSIFVAISSLHRFGIRLSSSISSRGRLPDDGKSLSDFIRSATTAHHVQAGPTTTDTHNQVLEKEQTGGRRHYCIETYGCQMNVSDSEIVDSILTNHGFQRTSEASAAEIVLINTCSIRERAEDKVWSRLYELRALRQGRKRRTIAVLGCMAERLKTKLLEVDQLVDVVAGPDSYRDLPRLLSLADGGESAVNVLLSLDETYADIAPVRLDSNSVSAYVSIMRGCNNLCSYCIVPYTRGRERSRNAESIINEVRQLSQQGFKEITLLGQNVNSYNDISQAEKGNYTLEDFNLTSGFSQKTKRSSRMGIRFPELLRRCAEIDPEIRLRFTSPHPKDFPYELLQVIADFDNVCNSVHIPAQSGSNAILEAMKRDYTVEAYKELISAVRDTIPGCAITSDFITGFCGETEMDHEMSLDLIRSVGYSHAFMFAYSQRENTTAQRRLQDDVPSDVKGRRLREMTELFHNVARSNAFQLVGTRQLVLVEGDSKRSHKSFSGRSDSNIKVVFPKVALPGTTDELTQIPDIGTYVSVDITSATQRTMLGTPVNRTTLQGFHDSRSC